MEPFDGTTTEVPDWAKKFVREAPDPVPFDGTTTHVPDWAKKFVVTPEPYQKNAPRAFGTGFMRGVYNLSANVASVPSMMRNAVGNQGVMGDVATAVTGVDWRTGLFSEALSERTRALGNQRHPQSPGGEKRFYDDSGYRDREWWAERIGELLPEVAAQAVSAAGGPVTFATVGGSNAAAAHYDAAQERLISKGHSPQDAKTIASREAMVVGAITAGLDKVGFSKIFGETGTSVAGKALGFGKAGVTEGVTEASQEIAAQGVASVTDRDFSGFDADFFANQVAPAGALGTVAGAGMHTVSGIAPEPSLTQDYAEWLDANDPDTAGNLRSSKRASATDFQKEGMPRGEGNAKSARRQRERFKEWLHQAAERRRAQEQQRQQEREQQRNEREQQEAARRARTERQAYRSRQQRESDRQQRRRQRDESRQRRRGRNRRQEDEQPDFSWFYDSDDFQPDDAQPDFSWFYDSDDFRPDDDIDLGPDPDAEPEGSTPPPPPPPPDPEPEPEPAPEPEPEPDSPWYPKESLTHRQATRLYMKWMAKMGDPDMQPYNTVGRNTFEFGYIDEDGNRIPQGRGQIKGRSSWVPMDDFNNGTFGFVLPFPTKIGKFDIGSWVKKYFTSLGHAPDVLRRLREQQIQRVRKHVRFSRMIVDDFEKAVKKTYGKSIDKLPQATIDGLNAALQDESLIGQLPSDVQGPVRLMRKTIDNLSHKVKQSGLISDNMQIVFDHNTGKYTVRSYRIFDDKNWGFDTLPENVLNGARLWFRQNLPEDMPATDKDIDNYIKDFLSDRRDKNPVLRGMRLAANDLTSLLQRKDIDKPIRELMGEYSDPRVNYSRSVLKLANMISTYNFQKKVRAAGEGVFLFRQDDPNRPEDYNYRLGRGDDSALGPLAGLRTSEEIGEIFENAFNQKQAQETWLNFWMKYVVGAKAAKTVLAIGSQIRNVVSNHNIAMGMGYNPKGLFEAFRILTDDMRKTPHAEARNRILQYIDLGIIGEDVVTGDLMDLLKVANRTGALDFLFDPNATIDALNTPANRAKDLTGKAWRVVQRLYVNGDALWKIAAFELEKQRYSHLYSGAELNQHAAEIVKNTWPTYNRIPRAVAWLRRFPLTGTFVSFPAEVLRTYKNGVVLAAQEMRHSDPKIRKTGARRMAGQLARLSYPLGLAVISQALTGVSDEEDEAIRAISPEWERNNAFVYLGRDENGVPITMDYSYVHTDQIILKPLIAALGRGDVEDAFREIRDPFTSPDMATSAAIDAMWNWDKERGRPVYDESLPADHKLYQAASHIWNEALEPGTVRDVELLGDSATGKQRPDGSVISPGQAALRLAGIRTKSRKPEVQAMYAANQFRRRRISANQQFTSVARSQGTPTESELMNAYRRMELSRRQQFSEMSKIMQAAVLLTDDPQKVFDQIDDTLSERDKKLLLAGQYEPWTPTDEFLRSVPQQQQQLVFSTIERAYEEINRELDQPQQPTTPAPFGRAPAVPRR